MNERNLLGERIIRNIAIEPEGDMEISYFTPRLDVTTPGAVHVHTLIVPAGFDYDDEMRAVLEAADFLIGDVLDDWDKLPKLTDEPEEDDPDG